MSELGNIARTALVTMATARAELYYHHSSNTHIVQQLDGTEFSEVKIKGCGAFTDDAFLDYKEKLDKAVSKIEASKIRSLARKLEQIPSELQDMRENSK